MFMKKYLIISFIVLLALTGCKKNIDKNEESQNIDKNTSALNESGEVVIDQSKNQSLELETKDGYKIAADFYSAESLDLGVILIHQYDSSKESYSKTIPYYTDNGINVVAIDLRGHGQSSGDLSSFKDKDYQLMLNDIEAAVNWLQNQNLDIKISLVGASVGANLAMLYADQDEKIVTVVTLSPGLNYHGLETKKVAERMKRPIIYIAAVDDEYAKDSVVELYDATPLEEPEKKIYVYRGSVHGTEIIEQQASLLEYIPKWILQQNQ